MLQRKNQEENSRIYLRDYSKEFIKNSRYTLQHKQRINTIRKKLQKICEPNKNEKIRLKIHRDAENCEQFTRNKLRKIGSIYKLW